MIWKMEEFQRREGRIEIERDGRWAAQNRRDIGGDEEASEEHDPCHDLGPGGGNSREGPSEPLTSGREERFHGMGGFPQLPPHVPRRVERIREQGVFREELPRKRRLQSLRQARALDVLCEERIEEAENDEAQQETAERVRELEGGDESFR